MRYTKESIIEAIQRFHEVEGKVPRKRDFLNNFKYPSFKTVQNRFGSWNKGIEAAGFTINGWTKQEIIEAIQRFYQINERIPKARDFSKNLKYPSYETVRNRFGSWNRGIKTAGFTLINIGKKNNNFRIWTKQEIIEAIQKFYQINRRIPQAKDFISNCNYPGYQTVITHFDSWNRAIEISGFKANYDNGFGTRIFAKDNHLYRSHYEVVFVNKMLYQQYKYKIESKYPNYNLYYDWYLPKLDLYIELDGGCRPEVMKRKIKINKRLGRKLLVVYPKDLDKYNSLEEMINAKA